jgi:hypothetical protein
MPLESNAINLVAGAAAAPAEPPSAAEHAAPSTADVPEAASGPGSAMDFLANFPLYPFI